MLNFYSIKCYQISTVIFILNLINGNLPQLLCNIDKPKQNSDSTIYVTIY